MKSRLWVLPCWCALFLLVVFAAQILGAQELLPLDVKTGLWEVTHTSQTGGMPPLPSQLRLTPEQRAKIEEAWKANAAERAKPQITKTCITKEKLTKETPFGENQPSCKRTVLTSTSSKLEVQEQCPEANGMKMNLTFRVEAVNSENIKGVIEAAMSGGSRAMNTTSNITGRWVSPVCGTVK